MQKNASAVGELLSLDFQPSAVYFCKHIFWGLYCDRLLFPLMHETDATNAAAESNPTFISAAETLSQE